MNTHRYVRAYMAGISVPTPLLLVALTVFLIGRFVYDVPVPIERVIIFPMAIVPNLFGLWNVVHLASHAHMRLPLGIHGAILPFILAPLGFLVGRGLGFLTLVADGFSYFGVIQIHYAHLALIFPLTLILYYLVWKYLVGFFNRVAGIAE